MTWLEHAMTRSVVVRAARTSLVVGTVLVAINQGDLIVRAGLAAVSIPKLLLTYFVPYAVSTTSSVASRIEGGAAAGRPPVTGADAASKHGAPRGSGQD